MSHLFVNQSTLIKLHVLDSVKKKLVHNSYLFMDQITLIKLTVFDSLKKTQLIIVISL